MEFMKCFLQLRSLRISRFLGMNIKKFWKSPWRLVQKIQYLAITKQWFRTCHCFVPIMPAVKYMACGYCYCLFWYHQSWNRVQKLTVRVQFISRWCNINFVLYFKSCITSCLSTMYTCCISTFFNNNFLLIMIIIHANVTEFYIYFIVKVFIKFIKAFIRIVKVVYNNELRESALYEDWILPCWHPICMKIFTTFYANEIVI